MSAVLPQQEDRPGDPLYDRDLLTAKDAADVIVDAALVPPSRRLKEVSDAATWLTCWLVRRSAASQAARKQKWAELERAVQAR